MYTIPSGDLKNLRSEMTLVAGQIVYRSASW
jgi:predicted amidohydrolase YtcJ